MKPHANWPARRSQRPAPSAPGHRVGKAEGGAGALLEAALTRANLQAAEKRVKAAKAAAGADGLDIAQTARWLRTSWPQTRQALLAGMDRPHPVRRVMLPEPGRSQREAGIPAALDRLIWQALLQELQPRIDLAFSEHSHGFRPGRQSHDAVNAAWACVLAADNYLELRIVDARHACKPPRAWWWTWTWRSSSTGSTTTS